MLATLFDVPRTRKKMKKLQSAVKERWIPNKKYIFLTYEQSSSIKDALEEDIIKQYGGHMVVMDWDTLQATDVTYQKDAQLMDDTVIRDYDGQFTVALVTIDRTLNMKHVTPIDDEDFMNIEQKETIELFRSEIEACLKGWK
ncbi:MAG TPA: hypothetical protein VLG09_03190 [Candidatus Saccharimonadales bacterium]|nr:hypothetical protein [Candidatus Saccharimonadales bacterium]